MKLLLSSIFAALFICSLSAQTPHAFNYQAVARDLTGTPLPDQAIGVRVSILEGSITGTEIFQETHSLTTTSLGLFNLQVGNGAITSGDIATIDWGSSSYFIEVAIDENGGTNYQVMGTSQFLSVPYAEYANNGSKWNEVEVDSRIQYPNKVNIGQANASPFDYSLNINGSEEGPLGLSILNSNSNGRSIMLVGESNNQQYLYTAYHGANWNPQYSAFQASAGVIFTGGVNGLNQVSPSGDINFITGGLELNFTRLVVKEDGNIGIGTITPAAKLQVEDGDVYIKDINNGVIMKSPNGQCWRYTPDNTGQLVPTSITCPN